MKISLIICTRNRPDVLISNLNINGLEFEKDDEIVIVDSSEKHIFNKIESAISFDNVGLYNVEPGLPRQRNIGISKAKGDIILFLDDDIKLLPMSIRNLRNYFLINPNVDAVTGGLKEKSEPSRLRILFTRVLSYVFFTPAFGKSGFTKAGLPIIPLSYEKLHTASFLRGGFTAYRRKVFETLRYDEKFEGYAYLEDTDFSLSMRNRYSAVFLPEFSGYHDHLSSVQKDHSLNREKYITNYRYIYAKHKIGGRFVLGWALLGIFIINLVKSLSSLNFSYTFGTYRGILNVLSSRA